MLKTPQTWSVECNYCQTMSKWGRDHESEIMDKARKFCISPFFLQFVQSELDWADHSKLDPNGQIKLLCQIHDKTGCHCQDDMIKAVETKVRDQQETPLYQDQLGYPPQGAPTERGPNGS